MEENRMPDFDESESVWEIDGPMRRKNFIWNMIGIFLLLGLPALLLNQAVGALLFPVILILLLCAIWLSFATLSKRFWDITGSKMWGIIIAIIVTICQSVPLIGILALIVAACVPGTCLKVSKK